MPGYWLDFNVIETTAVKNKIMCVRACRANPQCKALNAKTTAGSITCDLHGKRTNQTAILREDAESSFLCEIPLCLLKHKTKT